MNDDYLWNRSGPPDPDVVRLEEMLGRLRSAPDVPQIAEVRLKPDTTSRKLWRPAFAGREVRLKADTTSRKLRRPAFAGVALRLKAETTSRELWRPSLAGRKVRLRADSTDVVWSVRSLAPMLAVAAAMLLMIGQTYQSTRGAASWEVARLDGRPRIGG